MVDILIRGREVSLAVIGNQINLLLDHHCESQGVAAANLTIFGQQSPNLWMSNEPRNWFQEIDSASLYSLAGGTSNKVAVPAHQAGNRIMGSLKGLQIRAMSRNSVLCTEKRPQSRLQIQRVGRLFDEQNKASANLSVTRANAASWVSSCSPPSHLLKPLF